jgi:hypothetical protein
MTLVSLHILRFDCIVNIILKLLEIYFILLGTKFYDDITADYGLFRIYYSAQQFEVMVIGSAIIVQVTEFVSLMMIMHQQCKKSVDDIYQDHYQRKFTNWVTQMVGSRISNNNRFLQRDVYLAICYFIFLVTFNVSRFFQTYWIYTSG